VPVVVLLEQATPGRNAAARMPRNEALLWTVCIMRVSWLPACIFSSNRAVRAALPDGRFEATTEEDAFYEV
jgi:hypothetical protein